MSSFKKTNIKYYSKANVVNTADSQYWKNFEFPVTVKEYSLIDHIDVSPVEPYYIAVTTGPKIDIYHQQSAQVVRSITRFQKCAYGATFRHDGKLLVAGSEKAQVKLFNYQKQLLRVFNGHKGPVHAAKFVNGNHQICSFSDDKSVKIWDVTSEKEVCSMDEHKDFIRTGAASPTSEHIIVSGSYDHEIKIWDTRTGKSMITFNHESPISKVLFYPTGSVLATAGGMDIKIWDAVAGKLISVLSQHHKTITCLSLASDNQRLLSGSLDQHIKIYDLNTYAPVHTIDYPAPILAIAVAVRTDSTPMDSTIVTGMLSKGPNPMVGGTALISFEHKKIPEENPTLSKSKAKDPIKHLPVDEFRLNPGDEVVNINYKAKMAKFDQHLCKFQYTKALDCVLQHGIINNHPQLIVSVFRELIRRNALASTLVGRSVKSLNLVFRFLTKYIRCPYYSGIVIEVANTLLDVYGEEFGVDNNMLVNLKKLSQELEVEMAVTKSVTELLGVLEMFSAVSSSSANIDRPSDPDPSNEAKHDKVVVDIR